MKTQHGAAMVEFALIALLFFMILFGIIEFGRAWFTYNTLVEATRRGARVAAVCPPGDIDGGIDIDNSQTKIENVVLFNASSSNSTTGFLGLTRDNVNIEYLQSDLSTWIYSPDTVTAPDGSTVETGNIDDIAFVRVSIVDFQHTLIIPLFGSTFFTPSAETTLPAESLGRETPNNPLAVSDRRCTFP